MSKVQYPKAKLQANTTEVLPSIQIHYWNSTDSIVELRNIKSLVNIVVTIGECNLAIKAQIHD